MKQVDILTSLPMQSSIGPVQTIRRIVNSRDFFYERGYNITLFTRDIGESAPYKPKTASIMKSPWKRHLYEVVTQWMSKHTLYWPKKIEEHYFANSKKMLENYKKLNRKPDVVVFHLNHDCYLYLTQYRLEGVKVVYFEHDDGSGDISWYGYPKAQGSYLQRDEENRIKYIMENLDVKACITRITEKNLLRRFPCLEGKTCLVINGISDLTPEQLKESETIRKETKEPKYRFISTGSMGGRKGHREIIEALHAINSTLLKDIRVCFLGGGSERASLEKLVADYHLQDVVKFEGVVPNAEVYKYQAKSNISILISKTEGLPLALLEGMRNGLALLSTKVSGIPEIIDDGVNGVLINPDVNELTEVFNNLDKYDWDAMGKASRLKFEEYYNFPRMREDYLKMLNKAVAE